MPKLIDSHCHVNFNTYQDDGTEVIRRCLDKDIWLINVGSQYTTSRRAFNIAAEYSIGVYAAIGLHPIHLFKTHVDEEEIKFATQEEQFDAVKYQALIDADRDNISTEDSNKIIAVGEIGLDYYHLPKNYTLDEVKTKQAQELVKQLNFADQNNLPVILHCRGSVDKPLEAYHDLLKIVKRQMLNVSCQLSGVLHCYGGDLAIAQEFIKLGFYIGFTGIITFGKNAEGLRQIVKTLPLDKILIETDAPYLAPDPHRGQRNEPNYVELVAQKIAEIKNVTFAEVAQQTTNNSQTLFNI